SLVLIVPCALFFHINNLNRSLVSSELSQFSIDLLESVTLGFLASALLFRVFPGLVPRLDTALLAAVLIGLLPLNVRLVLRYLVTHGKGVEDILIVGTGDLPAKLHRALGRSATHSGRQLEIASPPQSRTKRWGSVDLAELSELVVRDQISRVVIAEL